MKKIISIIICMVLMVSLVAGCGKETESANEDAQNSSNQQEGNTESNSDGADEQEKVTIKILDTYGGMVEEMLALYEELNPNVIIDYEFVSSDQYYAKFTALNVSGDTPDVIWTNANYLVEQVQGDLVMDLTSALEETQNYEEDDLWGDTFNSELLQNSRNVLRSLGDEYLSKSYGVPYTMTTVAVIYDKALFRELGIEVPTNWEEFEANNEIIKASGHIPISMQQQNIDWWPRIFWDQYCRSVLDENPDAFAQGDMTFDDESVKEALAYFKEMWDKGWFPESSLTATRETMQQLFVQGELGQLLIIPNYLDYISENVPEDVEIGTYALPGIKGLPTRCLGGSSNIWAVSNQSENPDEAVRLVKFLTSKTAFSEDYAQFINSGLANDTRANGDNIFNGFIEAGNGGFIPDIYVPVNVTTELANTFKSDLLPNYLLGVYDIEYVTSELNRLYHETYLSNLNQ